MRRSFAFILALTIAASAMTDIGHYGHYLVNKAYIAANFCVNKLKPEVNCEGKCYLMDKIQKDKEEDSDQLPAQRELSNQLQYVDLANSAFPHFYFDDVPHETYRYASDYHFLYDDRIFHPPRFHA